MKHTFILRNLDVKKTAANMVFEMPVEPLHECIVRPHKKDRSVAQNALLWMWYTIIAGELGETKEEIHNIYKGKILVHIYERDDVEYAAMVEAVREVHRKGMKVEAKRLADAIVDLTSTTRANVDQFTEYLNDIEKDAISKGIALPHPEDRYYDAMGIKQPERSTK